MRLEVNQYLFMFPWVPARIFLVTKNERNFNFSFQLIRLWNIIILYLNRMWNRPSRWTFHLHVAFRTVKLAFYHISFKKIDVKVCYSMVSCECLTFDRKRMKMKNKWHVLNVYSFEKYLFNGFTMRKNESLSRISKSYQLKTNDKFCLKF